ncbi:hypothetical protein Pcinc_022235 [Petrolisthes cinctipes]|uniref:Uncharacterized protein n=1 Tax=Petrolisthes cinctipes TaxID=88211 RepID=A0AAE1FF57_PETCI|nr:hypothetical protein Pcinc_022235 [Petrolisthes cinctipes]
MCYHRSSPAAAAPKKPYITAPLPFRPCTTEMSSASPQPPTPGKSPQLLNEDCGQPQPPKEDQFSTYLS